MEEPKPPRRISDASESQNIKRRCMPAVRTWPAGCGPRSDESQPSDQIQLLLEDGEISEEGQMRNSDGRKIEEGQNGNCAKREEVYPYPPPKRRGVLAFRTWPAGCGIETQIERNNNGDNDLESIERDCNDVVKEGLEREKAKGVDVVREGLGREKAKGNGVIKEGLERERAKGNDVGQEGLEREKARGNDMIKEGLEREKAKDDFDCVGFRDVGREKIKDRGKELQRKGVIKPVRIKIIRGKNKSDPYNAPDNFSKSPAELAKDRREKSDASNSSANFSKSAAELAKERIREKSESFEASANFSKNPAEVAKEKREKSESSEASNNYFSKSTSELAKEKRERYNRLNFASKNVKIIAKKRVGIKRKTDYISRFESQIQNATNSEESEPVASQAIMLHKNSSLKTTARKSVSHRSFGTGFGTGTNTSHLTSPRTDFNKKPARKSNYNNNNNNKAIVTSSTFSPLKKGTKKPKDPRAKVKRCQFLFQTICRKLIHEEETGNKPPEIKLNRIDLRAAKLLREKNEVLNKGNPIIGAVPGVQIGDEYRYRAELSILGLHRPPQAGIDYCDKNGVRLAASIVASGGYSDAREYSDLLIYTGAGGQPNPKLGRLQPEDQKLERGNLALKNSMDMKSPVRVIHGVNIGESSKVVMSFAYDGLYLVEEFWNEMQSYEVKNQRFESSVFKFQLRRIAGQPELTWNKATRVKRSTGKREGLCVKDISGGKEKKPICAINTIDDEKPPAFEYITRTIYPSWYAKSKPKGCKCKGKCSESEGCECVVKNGGEIPFNSNGAIVQAKTLVYECGPACQCSKSCPNRVTQYGIQIPLEIFKTETRGWGVRSLNSIASGSFICEYVGELLTDNEANERENDEYLFEIGKNYDDVAIWGDLPSFVPGLKTESGPTLSEGEMEGFTIDAAVVGNVGRFINHSCSPNLYAQNILYDHHDKKMPHIMFFAAENIPPLQELTYHYNYKIGEVLDFEGNVKMKNCYCGSSQCEGRLY